MLVRIGAIVRVGYGGTVQRRPPFLPSRSERCARQVSRLQGNMTSMAQLASPRICSIMVDGGWCPSLPMRASGGRPCNLAPPYFRLRSERSVGQKEEKRRNRQKSLMRVMDRSMSTAKVQSRRAQFQLTRCQEEARRCWPGAWDPCLGLMSGVGWVGGLSPLLRATNFCSIAEQSSFRPGQKFDADLGLNSTRADARHELGAGHSPVGRLAGAWPHWRPWPARTHHPYSEKAGAASQ